MSDEKLEASVPVWVEIVPTVTDVGVSPGTLAVAAPAALVVATRPTSSIAPVSAVAVSALIPCRTCIPSPIIGRASPRDAGHCSCRASRPLLTLCGSFRGSSTSPNRSAITRVEAGDDSRSSVQKQPPSVVLTQGLHLVETTCRELFDLPGHVGLVPAQWH